MVLVRSSIPKRPFYISDSNVVNGSWVATFNTGVQALGTQYGVSEADKEKVAEIAVVVAAFMLRLGHAEK